MSSLTCLISGVSYPVKTGINYGILNAYDALEVRGSLDITIIDYAGTMTFLYGQPVVLSDSDLGTIFEGFVGNDKPTKLGPIDPTIEHALTCFDKQYLVDKRTNSTNYLGWYAGDIVVDFVKNILADEGITVAAAMRRDTTDSNFNQGTLAGTVGTLNLSDDGCLELAKAGTNLTITETLTADFATGTLTNMQAVSDTLVPTTVNALKMQSTLSFAYGIEFAQEQQAASGTVSGSGSGTASGSFSTTVFSNGTASGTVNPTGSFTPSGSVFISGGNPGESATFSGSSGSVFTSGSFSAGVSSSGTASATVNSSVSTSFSTSATLDVSKTYKPKTKSKVKIDGVHYDVITVDRDVADNRIDAVIWTGSMTIGSNDTLNYDIWIASTSPSQEAGVDLFFSDGTQLTEYLGSAGSNNDVGIWDQNLVSVSPIQDLSDHAKDAWYIRQVNLSPLSGKTITSVSLFNSGNNAGTYDIYVKNCYLGSHSGSPFFGTSQSAPSQNPPTLSSIGAYVRDATLVTVVPVYDPAQSMRISPAYSIDSVKLVRDSLITWTALNPAIGPAVVVDSPGAATVASKEAVFVSYDGTTWLPCTNNQPLPGLPAGAKAAGLSLYLKETFAGGQDPTAIPTLMDLTITIHSAPQATTNDIVSAFGTTTAWNTGSMKGVAPDSNGDLELGTTSYTWSNLNDMTFVPGSLSASNPTQSVSSGTYTISSPGASSATSWSSSRFNFISATQDFTAEADFTLNGGSSPHQNEIGFVYRQTYWGSPNNSFAYYVRIMQAPGGQAGGTSITLGYGVNSPPTTIPAGGGPATGTFTVITQVSRTISNNTTYHVKLVVSGNRHTIYWNGSTTPVIDVLDDTYTAPGNVGIRTYVDSPNSCTGKITNFTITNTFAGIWTSPSISLNSLGTCGNTQIAWAEVTPAGTPQANAIVSASLDGGTTWKQCTNAASSPTVGIPGLDPGTNVTGKSIKFQVVLSATGFLERPVITGLYMRVCGAYPGSSGTRSTAPVGNDTVISRPDQSGFGTAFDGQAYTKVGTGTDAVSSGNLVISNTTGDVHEHLGTATANDQEVTVQFQLTSSGMSGGVELRYQDVNNFYRLAISPTTISIVKMSTGIQNTLQAVSAALSLNTWYWLRFRVIGSTLVTLYGRIWQVGTLENQTNWTVNASD